MTEPLQQGGNVSSNVSNCSSNNIKNEHDDNIKSLLHRMNILEQSHKESRTDRIRLQNDLNKERQEKHILKRQLEEEISYNKRIKNDDFKNLKDDYYYSKFLNNNEKLFSWFISIGYLFELIGAIVPSSSDDYKTLYNFKELSQKIRNYFYQQHSVHPKICDKIAISINYHFKRDLYRPEQIIQIETIYNNPNIYDNISEIMIEISKNDKFHQQYHKNLPIITTNPHKYLKNGN